MKKLQQGFTLIELMIVVAIIGILAAVAIPAYQDYIVKSKLSKVQSTMDPLKLALTMYYQENGSFPVTAAPANVTATAVDATNKDTAITGTTSADQFYTSLGLGKYPSIPTEVKTMNVASTGTTGTGVTIDLILTNIKGGTCGTAGSATSTAGLDSCTLTMTGTPGGTAVVWSYTGNAMGNIIAAKYFK